MAIMSFGVADFYSSMTKVDYVEGSKTLKFTTKMNTSHIADAIKINPNTAGFEAEVKKYVNNNFDLYVNGNAKVLTFTGSQVNGESVWVYYEAGGVGEIYTYLGDDHNISQSLNTAIQRSVAFFDQYVKDATPAN